MQISQISYCSRMLVVSILMPVAAEGGEMRGELVSMEEASLSPCHVAPQVDYL